jgi:hypothetical protein
MRQQLTNQGLKARKMIARGEAPGAASRIFQSPVRAAQDSGNYFGDFSINPARHQ